MLRTIKNPLRPACKNPLHFRTMKKLLLGLALALAAVSCGDDSPAPTAPTPTPTPTPPPAATPQELTVHAPQWFADSLELEVGREVQLRANITMSDGTTQEGVEAEWTSSNTVVATISSSGLLAGRQPGGFNVRVDAEGLSTTLSGLRVVPPPSPDFTIRDVHRYQALDHAAHWIEFDVHAHVAISRLELGIRVHATGLFVDCDQTLRDFDPGELQEKTVIPNVCGLDEQWSYFTITPPDGLRCEGCGRYNLEDVRESRDLQGPAAAARVLRERRSQ